MRDPLAREDPQKIPEMLVSSAFRSGAALINIKEARTASTPATWRPKSSKTFGTQKTTGGDSVLLPSLKSKIGTPIRRNTAIHLFLFSWSSAKQAMSSYSLFR